MAKKKTVIKKKAPTKAKKSVRGKRYTAAEKKTVVDFVNKVNAEKGRGGVAAAVRKFGASALTINAWVKAAGGSKPKAKKKVGKRGPGRRSSGTLLQQLVSLESDIISLENDLAAKRAEFDKLKKKL